MRHYEINDTKGKFVRISKATARKMYDNGEIIVLCPVKIRPGAPWHFDAFANNDNKCTFDSLVSSFEFCNCNLNECGKYAAFYSWEPKI